MTIAALLFAPGLLLTILPPPSAAPPAAVPAAVEARLPDTPAGRTLGAFLEALAYGDAERLTRFHAEHAAADKRGKPVPEDVKRQDADLAKRTGGFRVERVERSEPAEIEVVARSVKSSRPVRLSVSVEPAPPHGILGIGLRPMSEESGPGAKVTPVPEARLAEALGEYLGARATAGQLSGTVLVARGDAVLFQKAYGSADREKGTPNTVDTKFNLGSMNKMFTAVAIAQLAEQGKLSFDDPVGRHLPDYPNRTVREKVTIHQLLTHTSGLGSYWNERFEKAKSSIRTVSDYLALFSDEDPKSEPGSRFSYSNSGYIVLGAIVEKVSGKSYYDYVKERVFKPAGMVDTDSYERSQSVPNLAAGYTTGDDDEDDAPAKPQAARRNDASRPNRGGPAGGGYSTAPDLFRFAKALRDHTLLSAAMTERVLTGKTKAPMGSYGYGFGNVELLGRRGVGHNGGAPGIGAELLMVPETGHTIVVLTNQDPPLMQPIVRAIAGMALPAPTPAVATTAR